MLFKEIVFVCKRIKTLLRKTEIQSLSKAKVLCYCIILVLFNIYIYIFNNVFISDAGACGGSDISGIYLPILFTWILCT